jgi:hypothetical protein
MELTVTAIVKNLRISRAILTGVLYPVQFCVTTGFLMKLTISYASSAERKTFL